MANAETLRDMESIKTAAINEYLKTYDKDQTKADIRTKLMAHFEGCDTPAKVLAEIKTWTGTQMDGSPSEKRTAMDSVKTVAQNTYNYASTHMRDINDIDGDDNFTEQILTSANEEFLNKPVGPDLSPTGDVDNDGIMNKDDRHWGPGADAPVVSPPPPPPPLTPTAPAPTQQEQEANFYAALDKALAAAKAGDSQPLRDFDNFFGITRPGYEYDASFYLPATPGFNEQQYLEMYPDVAAAVKRGDFASGLQHYQTFGAGEHRLLAAAPVGYDEQKYLANNPDVAAAVASGAFVSGLEHYQLFGAGEGRAGVFSTVVTPPVVPDVPVITIEPTPAQPSVDAKFVNDAYQSYLGREATPDEISFQINAAKDLTQAQFIDAIRTSAEAGNYNANFIRSTYETYFGREATQSEIDSWSGEISKGSSTHDSFISNIKSSPAALDYSNIKFLKDTLKSFGAAEPNQETIDAWLAALRSGNATHQSLIDTLEANQESIANGSQGGSESPDDDPSDTQGESVVVVEPGMTQGEGSSATAETVSDVSPQDIPPAEQDNDAQSQTGQDSNTDDSSSSDDSAENTDSNANAAQTQEEQEKEAALATATAAKRTAKESRMKKLMSMRKPWSSGGGSSNGSDSMVAPSITPSSQIPPPPL